MDSKKEAALLHHVLINKTTGKVASNSSWLKAIKAHAYLYGDYQGIAGLLTKDGEKYLKHNAVVFKKQRKQDHENAKARVQAKALLPLLAAIWGEQLPRHRAPRRQDFAHWVAREFRNRNSAAFSSAVDRGYNELIDANRSARWWLDQLEKMQS